MKKHSDLQYLLLRLSGRQQAIINCVIRTAMKMDSIPVEVFYCTINHRTTERITLRAWQVSSVIKLTLHFCEP